MAKHVSPLCVRCSSEVPSCPTGRPRRYCGELCKRAAEFEARRLRRRIAVLEAEARPLRACARDPFYEEHRDLQGRDIRHHLAPIERAVRGLRKRAEAVREGVPQAAQSEGPAKVRFRRRSAGATGIPGSVGAE